MFSNIIYYIGYIGYNNDIKERKCIYVKVFKYAFTEDYWFPIDYFSAIEVTEEQQV